MKLYLRVTKDEYELPLAVADSAQELAVMMGTTKKRGAVQHLQKAQRLEKDCDR